MANRGARILKGREIKEFTARIPSFQPHQNPTTDTPSFCSRSQAARYLRTASAVEIREPRHPTAVCLLETGCQNYCGDAAPGALRHCGQYAANRLPGNPNEIDVRTDVGEAGKHVARINGEPLPRAESGVYEHWPGPRRGAPQWDANGSSNCVRLKGCRPLSPFQRRLPPPLPASPISPGQPLTTQSDNVFLRPRHTSNAPSRGESPERDPGLRRRDPGIPRPKQ
jgi:hypothetical protein